MKRVTASEARRNWFRLLDEVAGGEVVCIERGGHRILVQRDAESPSDAPLPDYASILRAPDATDADKWSWSWEGPEGEVRLLGDPDS